MHWIIYEANEHGRLTGLRIIESLTRPHAPTLNDGFKSAQDALILFSEYLKVSAVDGYVYIDAEKITHHVSAVERVLHAIKVQPALVWAIGGALLLGGVNLVLITLHMAGL